MARDRTPSAQTIELLAALLSRRSEWRHGYDLSEQTGLASGTLYPMLMRLSERGMLESKWEPSPHQGRPPRKLYRLNTAGATYARAHASPRAATLRVQSVRS